MRLFSLFVFFSCLAVPLKLPAASPYPPFDSKTLTTVKGTVLSVQKISLVNKPVEPNVQLIIQYKQAPMTILLGPEWFLEAFGIVLSPSDIVEIKGSLIKLKGHYLILASEIKTQDKHLELLNAQGFPKWLSDSSTLP